MTTHLRHPRRARVRTGAEYERVFKTGKRVALPAAALHWRAGDLVDTNVIGTERGPRHDLGAALALPQVMIGARRAPPTAGQQRLAEVSASGPACSPATHANATVATIATARLGLAVSRKVDPDAVGRNRIKRVWRDAFRHVRQQLPVADYVLVARPPCRELDNNALRQLLLTLLGRAGALPLRGANVTLSNTAPLAVDSLSASLPGPAPAEPHRP